MMFLKSSGLIAIGIAVGTVLTWGFGNFEEFLQLRAYLTAPEAGIRIKRQAGILTIDATPELLKIPAFQSVFKLQGYFSKILINPPSTTNKFVVRPVQLLVLNPINEKLTLHSCRGSEVRTGIPWAIRSIGYFLGGDVQHLRASDVDPLIAIEPEGARRIELMFFFSYVPTLQEFGFKEGLEPRIEKLEIQCEDQRGRTLSVSTKFIAGMNPPEANK